MLARTLFNEEHTLFRQSVRRLMQKEVAPHYDQWEKDGCVSRDLWRKAGALADLKVGDKVRIAFHADGTTSIADRIHLIGEPKGEGKPAKAPGGKKDGDTRVHGKITAVDATAGTITVDVHQKAAK